MSYIAFPSAVPEPSVYALFLVGLIIVLTRRHHRG
jgi:hypothetical protein